MNEKDKFSNHFRDAQPKFSRFYTIVLSKLGLTLPQYALLSQLVIAGTLPMTQISKRLHITKPAVTNLVDRLEKSKFLKRVPHPSDRRVYLLEIQPKGSKAVRETQSQILNVLLKTLAEFSAEEQKTINRYYASVSQALGEVLGKREQLKSNSHPRVDR